LNKRYGHRVQQVETTLQEINMIHLQTTRLVFKWYSMVYEKHISTETDKIMK
jgi:hypothetical protein